MERAVPGVTAWFAAYPNVGDLARFERAQQLMVRRDADRSAVHVAGPRCWVGHVAYRAYPVRTWTENEFSVVFEGHVHDRSEAQVRRDVNAALRRALAGESAGRCVHDFVDSADGEFAVVAVTSDNRRCIAFGDALGRLPLYVQRTERGVALARECKFVAAMADDWSFDRLALAEHIWLGYSLGPRTLFRGIERAAEHFCIDVRASRDGIEVVRSSSSAFRCDATPMSTTLVGSAKDLASKLVDASNTRARIVADVAPIVSLSGGHDSRSVLAALAHSHSDVVAVSFRRPGGRQANDVAIAERVAGSLGVAWSLVELTDGDAESEARLVWMKDGLNSAEMAPILSFLDAVVARWSERATLFTGDGGDKAFPDLRPARATPTLDALIDVIDDSHRIVRATDAEALCGLTSGTLQRVLRDRVASYPEPAMAHKAVHFQIAERSRKWIFEGEDRNRSFLWIASPAFSLAVLRAALAARADFKLDYRLYARLQEELSPALLRIPHADSGLRIDSIYFRARAKARRAALRVLGNARRVFTRRANRSSVSPKLRSETAVMLNESITRASKLASCLNADRAHQMIRVADRRELYNLRTLLMLDRLWTERIPGSPSIHRVRHESATTRVVDRERSRRRHRESAARD